MMGRFCLNFITLAAFLCILNFSSCFRTGAPLRKCESMVPGHFAPEQTEPSPFELIPNKVVLNGSEIVELTLSSDDDKKLKGFLIRLQPVGEEASSESGSRLGFFKTTEMTKMQSLDCFGVTSSGVTHVSNDEKNHLVFSWIAPHVEKDTEYEILATFVQSFWTVWPKVVQPQRIKVLKYLESTQNKPAETLTDIFAGCGKSKSCFGVPNGCMKTESQDAQASSSNECDMMATWRQVDGGSFLFEITGKIPTVDGKVGEFEEFKNGYVAVGLSSDQEMGDDSVVGCLLENGEPVIHGSFNVGSSNFGLSDNETDDTISSKVAAYSDGNLYCKFHLNSHTVHPLGKFFNLQKSRFHVLLTRSNSGNKAGLLPPLREEDKVISKDPVALDQHLIISPSVKDGTFTVFTNFLSGLFG